MRIAILADIHGNYPALEAVVQRLEELQPDYVIVNGDLINGIPFTTEVLDDVQATDWVVVRGNHEFYYLDFGTPRAAPGTEDRQRWGQLHWLVEQITPAQGNYLAMLPDERTLYLPGAQPLRIAHGVPGRNRVGFVNKQPDEVIIKEIQDVPERTLVSAHTHVQIDRHLYTHPLPESDAFNVPQRASSYQEGEGQHWHLINPGSVGIPLNRNPAAQFALLEPVAESVESGGWQVSHQQVAYDRRPALAAFAESGMLELGGVISHLFYWELVTAEKEIIYFYHWAFSQGLNADEDIEGCFRAYCDRTGRAEFVRERDPLVNR